MKLKLKIFERVLWLSLLEMKSDFVGLKSLRKARESLAIQPEEVSFYEYSFENNEAKWGQKNALVEKEIEIEEFPVNELYKTFERMNAKKVLEEQHMSLYEKLKEVM